MKTFTFRFTEAEAYHLVDLLYERQQSGDYYGRRDHYYARNQRLLDKIDNLNMLPREDINDH